MTSRRFICVLMLGLLAGAAALRADVVEESFTFDLEQVASLNPAPGTVITKENVESFRPILAPKLVDLISDEFLTITTGEAISMSTHPAYIDATRRYLGQTELGDAPGIIHNYIAGRPFPREPQLDDPRAGDKLAWNLRYTYSYDSGEVASFYWQYRNIRHEKIERELSFYASSLKFMHRHVQEPIPSMPKNPSEIYHGLYLKVLAPPDLPRDATAGTTTGRRYQTGTGLAVPVRPSARAPPGVRTDHGRIPRQRHYDRGLSGL